MIFKEVVIDDKSLFSEFDYICSDYVFSYIFMYCDLYKLKVFEDDSSVIIRSDDGKPSFYMPLGNTEHGIKTVVEYCSKNNIKAVFTKIPYTHVELFKNLGFKTKEDKNSFDYIYKNSDLLNYDGKEFRKQRNNLASYLKICTPSYTDDVNAHIKECMVFTEKYYNDNTDVIDPTLKMLSNLERLNCKGGIVWDDKTIQAFCVYEKISDNVTLSHVELTDNSHRGIHTYMINEMSKRINAEYINKEDDLGLSGLRRFKESYNPYQMLKKYTACYE